MKVKFLKNGKLYIVYTTHGNNIIFSHKSKDECYEWIFKQLHWS